MISPFSTTLLCSKVVRYVCHFNVSQINVTNVIKFHSGDRLCFPRRIPGYKSIAPSNNETENISKIPLTVAGKYKVFKDADSSVIRNTNEEKIFEANAMIDEYDEFEGMNTARGLDGVYDIEELVNILKKENARDVFVCAVPSKIKYVDYICIVTGRSGKHMLAMAEFIRKLFKRKSNKKDVIPALEGKASQEWIALDLGNIALHLFNQDTREFYDLETLWSVGREFDPKCLEQESHLSNILERHQIFLHDLKPKE